MKVKICGLNPTRDVQLCIDLKIDYLGFIFYEKSPRNINPADIKILSTALKDSVILVTGAGGSIGSEICRQLEFLIICLHICFTWFHRSIEFLVILR